MIRRAVLSDWDQIAALSTQCGLKMPTKDLLKDVFLVATRSSDEAIVGFVWAGIVGSGSVAYGDYLTVSSEAKGTAFRLCKAMAHELNAAGVKEIHCQVRLDNVPAAYESYKLMGFLGMGVLTSPFSLFVGEIKEGSERWVRRQSRPN